LPGEPAALVLLDVTLAVSAPIGYEIHRRERGPLEDPDAATGRVDRGCLGAVTDGRMSAIGCRTSPAVEH
jgi:hypothetical protein